jgi:hypothetical protein
MQPHVLQPIVRPLPAPRNGRDNARTGHFPDGVHRTGGRHMGENGTGAELRRQIRDGVLCCALLCCAMLC